MAGNKVAMEETAEACHKRGKGFELQEKYDEALECYEAAIELDSTFVPAYTSAADLFVASGYTTEAMGFYVGAIRTNPDSMVLKERFIHIARSYNFVSVNDVFKDTVLKCFKTEGMDLLDCGVLWKNIMQTDPVFTDLVKLANKKNFEHFCSEVKSVRFRPVLDDPFFLAGPSVLRIPDVRIEKLFVYLRRYFLEKKEQSFFPLVCSLAQYFYLAEYVCDTSPDEDVQVSALRKKIEENIDDAGPWDVMVFSCYRPLHSLGNAQDVAERFESPDIAAIIKLQIHDYARQVALAAQIEAITDISEGITRAVRDQYEQSPYPRWNGYSHVIYDESREGVFRDAQANILVAGCGTGHEACELAAVFPDARVTGIDLSRTSLAYATQKAEIFGIDNVLFKQADILALEGHSERYDFIASSGVLHHMEDPLHGWKILTGLLKPGGLMRIALYSDLARRSIVEARDVIEAQGYRADMNGIRSFRAACKDLLSDSAYQEITDSPEYYALSECRDLLFHVQEHRVDIAWIEDALSALGLTFSGFQLPVDVLNACAGQFPDDRGRLDLKHWAAFEKANPKTFMGMYRFWCKAGI